MARKRRRIVVRDRRKTTLRLAFVVLCIAVLVGIAFLTVFLVKSCRVKLVLRSVPLSSGELCCGTGDGILYVKDGALNFYSYKDEDNNFSKLLSGTPEGVAGTAGVKAVWSKTAVQIIGAAFDIKPKGEIRTVRAGESHVAVLSDLPGGSSTLSVCSSSGQEIYSLGFSEGSLVDFGFSEASGKTLWTMELVLGGGSPGTVITTYDLSRMSATGVINVTGQLVEDVIFTDSSVFVIGTESLVRYTAAGNREVFRVQLHGYRVADHSMDGDNLLVLLVPRNSGSYSTVRVLSVAQKDVPGETALTLTLGDGVIGCHLIGGRIIAESDASVTLYDKKGKSVETLGLPVGSTLKAVKLDDKHILLERSGEFDLLNVGK